MCQAFLYEPMPNSPAQLLGGDAFEVGGVEVDSDAPLPHGQLGIVHDGVGLDGEVLAANPPVFAPPPPERASSLEFRDFRPVFGAHNWELRRSNTEVDDVWFHKWFGVTGVHSPIKG